MSDRLSPPLSARVRNTSAFVAGTGSNAPSLHT